MKVAELATKHQTSADTVRFYTRIGLLKPSKNNDNGYKYYDSMQRQRLQFILSARQLGFTIEDISQVLTESTHHKSACPLVRRIIEQRLAAVEQQLLQMQLLRNKMLLAMNEWQAMPDREPNGDSVCHLIESFAQDSVAITPQRSECRHENR